MKNFSVIAGRQIKPISQENPISQRHAILKGLISLIAAASFAAILTLISPKAFAADYTLVDDLQQNADQIAEVTIANYDTYGVLPSVAVGQAFCESTLGKFPINDFNYWGLRARKGWRAFNSLEEGTIGYLETINNGRYDKALFNKDYKEQLKYIYEGGYCPNNPDYVDKVVWAIEAYDFTAYDATLFKSLEKQEQELRALVGSDNESSLTTTTKNEMPVFLTVIEQPINKREYKCADTVHTTYVVQESSDEVPYEYHIGTYHTVTSKEELFYPLYSSSLYTKDTVIQGAAVLPRSDVLPECEGLSGLPAGEGLPSLPGLPGLPARVRETEGRSVTKALRNLPVGYFGFLCRAYLFRDIIPWRREDSF